MLRRARQVDAHRAAQSRQVLRALAEGAQEAREADFRRVRRVQERVRDDPGHRLGQRGREDERATRAGVGGR